MKIEKIPWVIDPHTEAKHEILRRYLQAWMPILASANGRIIYFDGFAGPGEYLDKKGNKVYGSPIIAIKSFLEHPLKDKIKEVRFIFVEKTLQVFEYLKNLLAPYEKQDVKFEIINDEFNTVINEGLDKLEKKGATLAPTFCFIDPFGIKGIPLSTIKRIMDNRSCEVLINFMYDELNRFIMEPWNEKNVTALFGSEAWKPVEKIKEPKDRFNFLTGVYSKNLKETCGIKYIRTFVMKDKSNRFDYVLFFCTNNESGLKVMKEAMWKVDETGHFEFCDATYNPSQMLLFEKQPNYKELKRMILSRYKGCTVNISELINFVWLETPFLEKHLRKPILDPLDTNGEITVYCPKKRRKCTYPEGTLISFK